MSEVEWGNVHDGRCPVTVHRRQIEDVLAGRIQESYGASLAQPDVLAGIVTEYKAGGDQEELCECEPTWPTTSSPLVRLAEELVNNDGPAIYEALAAFLTHAQFVELGAMCDLCPIHYCDAAICRDDEETCQHADQ